MVEDVRLAVEGRCPVAFHGRMGGLVPTPNEVLGALKALRGRVEKTRSTERHAHTTPPRVRGYETTEHFEPDYPAHSGARRGGRR
jgi:hypothetical protein